MQNDEQIVAEYEFDQPPARVWRALTEPALLAKWLMENDMVPVAGHSFNFRMHPIGDWDGIVHCVMLEVTPHSRLVYSWKSGDLDTIVTWTLTPRADGGTSVRMVHSGFKPRDFGFAEMSHGWASKGVSIAEALTALD